MKYNIQKIIISLVIFSFFTIPVVTFATAWSGLVPCTGSDCDFNALMAMINKIISFIFLYMAVPIAAIMFFYAGLKLVTSGGSSENRSIAKKVFTSTVIGLAIAAGAWLIIRMILNVLGYNGSWIGF